MAANYRRCYDLAWNQSYPKRFPRNSAQPSPNPTYLLDLNAPAVAQLKDKIENVLNETRILVLGIQILIGFDFPSFFEPGYSKMAHYTQQIQLTALGLMLICLAVLLIPVASHRIVLHGRNTAH